MNTAVNWRLVGILWLLGGLAEPLWAGGAVPVIVVEVDTSGLPDDFKPPDDAARPRRETILGKIKQRLETAAVEILAEQYPLFSWSADSDPNRPASPDAVLKLQLTAELAITWRVAYQCSFQQRGRAATKLSISAPDLYADNDGLPGPDQIEADTVKRGAIQLRVLMGATNTEKWDQQFIREIPLTSDIFPAPNNQPFLVLPIQASQLRAHPDSVIEARLVSDLPGKGRQNSTILLSPGGQVYDQQFAGMQQCNVTKATLGGIPHMGWVRDIVDVITFKVVKEVRIFVAQYKRDYQQSYSLNP